MKRNPIRHSIKINATKDGLQGYCKSCIKNENQVNSIKHNKSWNKRSNEYTITDNWKKYHIEYVMNKYIIYPEHRHKCIDRAVANDRKK